MVDDVDANYKYEVFEEEINNSYFKITKSPVKHIRIHKLLKMLACACSVQISPISNNSFKQFFMSIHKFFTFIEQ